MTTPSPKEVQKFTDAAFAGDMVTVDALLAAGIPVNAHDNDGFTALHRVAVVGHVPMLQHLLAKGANVNSEDAYGDTPLHYSCFCGHREASFALLSAGADPQRPSKDGKTPIQSAVEEGHNALATAIQDSIQGAGAKGTPIRAPKPPSAPKNPAYAMPVAPKPPQAGKPAGPPPTSMAFSPFIGGPPGAPGMSVGGLDFSKGIIIEGEVKKKRKNKLMKWRHKYFVLSRTYGALFFWTGARDRVDGTIKKIRFETFRSVRYFPTKQGGKRFELRVITGRVMQLLASSPEEARKWVQILKAVLGPSMAAFRIQSVWRGHKARKLRRKMLAERNAAVARVAHGTSASAASATSRSAKGVGSSAPLPLSKMATAHAVHGAIKATDLKKAPGAADSGLLSVSLSPAGIIIEGELKKKNSTTLSSFFSSYRTRYFVLYSPDAALYYFESKAQRSLGTQPRAIPFLSFFGVKQLVDKRGAKTASFSLRVTAGRTFVFEARTATEAASWVEKLLSVLPRDNAAAIKIQARYRGWKARRLVRQLLAANQTAATALLSKYGARAPSAVEALKKAALVIQKYMRMYVLRKRYRAFMKERELAEQAAVQGYHAESRKQRAQKQASPWAKYSDATTGRPYWHNAISNETTWTDPESPVYAGWRELTDYSSGKVYYHNITSNEVSWELPAEAAVAKAAVKPKSRWIKKSEGATGRTFFANIDGGETSWTIPVAIREGSGRLVGEWFSKSDDGSGLKYYIQAETSATTWERPSGYESDEDYSSELLALSEWIEVIDPITKRPYFYNMTTKRRLWANPWVDVGGKKVSGAGAMVAPPSGETHPRPPAVVDVVDVSEARRKGPGSRRSSLTGGGSKPATPPASRRSSATKDVVLTPQLEWTEHLDTDSGQTYFFNAKTGETTWVRPVELGGIAPEAALPDEIVVYDVNEVVTFTMFANDALQQLISGGATSHAAGLNIRLPISLEEDPPAIFSAVRDGVLAAALVTTFAPDALDLRAVDFSAKAIDKAERRKKAIQRRASARALTAPEPSLQSDPALENCRLAISAAQSAGAVFSSQCTAIALSEGKQNAVLEFLWQCMKVTVVNKVSVQTGNALLLQLAQADEDASALLALQPETLLLRWVNHHLTRAGSKLAGAITAFGSQLADGVALCALLRSIAPDCATDVPTNDAAATDAGPEGAVTAALSAAFAAGVPAIFSVEGIQTGNEKLQQVLCAYLLQHAASLEPAPAAPTPTASSARTAAAPASTKQSSAAISALAAEVSSRLALEASSEGGSREAASIAQWMNGLGVGPVVRGNALAADLKDGTTLLAALDKVEPGLVHWNKVNKKPGSNRYKQVENCNYIISLGRAMDFHLVNVAGLDIVDGNEKLVKAFMWQLMRYATLKQVSQIAFDGFTADESEILRWANERVATQCAAFGGDGASVAIGSFSEPTLCNGVYLLYLLSSLRSADAGVVDWSVVAPGESREEQVSNAKYVLSVARRLGVQVLCSFEDIVEVRAKPLMLFVALTMVADSRARKGLSSEEEGKPDEECMPDSEYEDSEEED